MTDKTRKEDKLFSHILETSASTNEESIRNYPPVILDGLLLASPATQWWILVIQLIISTQNTRDAAMFDPNGQIKLFRCS